MRAPPARQMPSQTTQQHQKRGRMSRSDPPAIVEPGAHLDESVEVGPYAVIGAHVTIGARTTVGSHSVIEGHTTLGDDNHIGHYASVGDRPQDMKYRNEPT